MHAAVTMEREVSLPFAPPSPAPARRSIERAESTALRLEVATVLEQRADDIAARWWEDARALLPVASVSTAEGTSASPDSALQSRGAALVRCLAGVLAGRADAADDVTGQGAGLGSSAFTQGIALHQLLQAFDRLTARCLDVVENAVSSDGSRVGAADAVRVCRALLDDAESIRLATACGFIDAAERVLQDRFRRLRHDLRNPIATIRSVVSLMADETVPEEARRSPRFSAMIDRNATALDQLVGARLSDAEARLVSSTSARAAGPASALLGAGEAGDDLGRTRQRDDREAGSL